MHGEVKILSNISNSYQEDKIECECLNCGAKFKRLFKDRKRKHQCSSFKNENGIIKKWCFKCKDWLELTYFQKAIHVYGGYSKSCRSCRKLYMNVAEPKRKQKNREFYEETGKLPNIKLHNLLNTAKNRANKNNLKFNLDIDYLRTLWLNQNGLCYYTDQPMKWAKQKVSFYSPSLDKLDPSKGYVKGNVAFCLFAINSFKQELTSKEFLSFVKTIKWKES